MEHLAGIHYGSVPLMAGAGFLMLLLAGYRIRGLPARAVLSLAGYLRPRPDPWLEGALRDAFAEFDRELSAVLHDTSSPVRPPGPARASRQPRICLWPAAVARTGRLNRAPVHRPRSGQVTSIAGHRRRV